MITALWIVLLVLLVAASSMASYLRLLLRRLTAVEVRALFHTDDARRVRADRERVGVSISALHGVGMALYAVSLTGLFIYRDPLHLWEDLGASLLLVFCTVMIVDQLIPFLWVARHDEPEAILRKLLPLLRAMVYVALPVTFPILISAKVARLLESPEEEAEPPKAEKGWEELIEAGEEVGLIEHGDRELIESAAQFGDKITKEVMTPRPEIAAVEVNTPIEEFRKLFQKKRYSRYPVYSKDLDHIEGVVSVRDLAELTPEEQARVTLRSLLKPVRFVPETKPVTDLLKELQKTTMQLAVVIDEYGSVSGLVTVEDLVEELVGEIRDEVEPHESDIVMESSNSYLVAGRTELAQVADKLHIELENGDYSTIGGLVLARLGHMPTGGEKIETNGILIEVLEVSRRAVEKVRVILPSTGAPAQAAHVGSQQAL